jgi:hypothetical protein
MGVHHQGIDIPSPLMGDETSRLQFVQVAEQCIGGNARALFKSRKLLRLAAQALADFNSSGMGERCGEGESNLNGMFAGS